MPVRHTDRHALAASGEHHKPAEKHKVRMNGVVFALADNFFQIFIVSKITPHIRRAVYDLCAALDNLRLKRAYLIADYVICTLKAFTVKMCLQACGNNIKSTDSERACNYQNFFLHQMFSELL